MEIHVLMGTNNPGKLKDAQSVASSFLGIKLHSPHELGITTDPEETGNSYLENAHIKRDAYLEELKRLGLNDYFVISDDSGLEIDALNGAPGIHSRRWKDGTSSMSDQAIVEYCLEQMKDVPDEKRTGAFKGIVTVGHPRKNLDLDIPYQLEGMVLRKAEHVDRLPGYPFRALFFLPQYGKLLHDVLVLPTHERPEGFLSHRELGLRKAYDAIQGMVI